ncbi:KV6A7 protein, partial [Steatornis caripensis]|nr:KV6A7 protein [Steatornis caripensis]
GAASAEGTSIWQSPAQLSVLPGETAKLSCHISGHSSYVNWYKEKPDGSLRWICQSSNYSSPVGKYSGRRETWCEFSLAILSAQREDSAVYYCSFFGLHPLFGNGTRLVVTDATQPELSILVPVDAEEPEQPPEKIPLLCHLRDLPAGWDTVRWQPGGDVTRVMMASIDERGVLRAWSITWVSAERW